MAACCCQQLLESYPQFQEARERITIQGLIPVVRANPALLTQCFSNLLNNALKFAQPGHPATIRIYAEDRGKQARIWFEDNGIGIPEESQAQIFKMFHRLNQDYEGTGIGLALVRKAAQRMRGTVGVESKAGQGSRFWLELGEAGGVSRGRAGEGLQIED